MAGVDAPAAQVSVETPKDAPGMTVARSGRFAGERDPAFVALNSSLALDWRLWREDIEGSVAHARALERAGALTCAERKAIEVGLAAVGRENRERRLRTARRGRGRAHGGGAPAHRDRR